MATPGAQDVFTPDNILQAMSTMRSPDREKKKVAMEYLDKFQKSMDAWNVTIGILQSSTDAEALNFAAITLKGKITYDLSTQVAEGDLPALRGQILLLLKKFAPGPKPVRVQLCVCLAILAIHMKDWKDVLQDVGMALGNDPQSHACVLDFLKVLPEEVTEGRKITLSEEELAQRTTELLGNNAQRVVQMLIDYATSSAEAEQNPQLMECITSWLKEVPVNVVVKTPLLDVVLKAVHNEQSTEPAAECLSTICRETRDIDDNAETIQILLPKLTALQPLIEKAVTNEDTESYKALTKLFADAGDAWVIAIAREPQIFMPLVQILLECCARDKERDVIEYTFNFWYELKQYITLERYTAALNHLRPIYSALVDVLLKHLQFPQSETGNELDLFDGDREVEEKFREFRHRMGDTLKDSCEVLGVKVCLTKVLDAIKLWSSNYGSTVNGTNVPHWQELEAPLFAMRAMGGMVPESETDVLPELMALLFQIPAHEKLRFAAIMVFSRYTEWTAAHKEFLEPQFNYIVTSFSTDSKEIIRAAAQAIKFFCTDCKDLLSDQVLQLQAFYDQILDKLPELSQEEITEGVANVVAAQKTEDIYNLLKLYCDPLMARLMAKAQNATTQEGKLAVADHLQLITLFVQIVKPYTADGQENPAVKYWQEKFSIFSTILENSLDFVPICERVCRCWRFMVISFRTSMLPILQEGLAARLVEGFTRSRQGCFLWVTGAILREFSEDREHVSDAVMDWIYSFFDTQARNVLQVMNGLSPAEAPDVLEDFFRLLTDALLYHHQRLIPSELFPAIFEAALTSLTLQQREPLSATLHFLRDLLTYGGDNPAVSTIPPGEPSQHLKHIVRNQLQILGEKLVVRVLNGMLHTFPRDCFADGSGVLLAMFQELPTQTTAWVERAISTLPAGSVSPAEATRMMTKIQEKLSGEDQSQMRQVRALLQDFTVQYRRRNIQQRDGLGEVDEVFSFSG
ncbi:hypothetical protein MCOR25_006993 [Pyricularia grisea]|uniref:Importin N-terminal domain-containing protein n=1 Tax=Pyricularia grisea TaxID=148305 RepID=A0A6P8BBV1_PYRGI|nr:uncharacterized protein PgNI_04067 [Pyricularia grisea]KAI6359666.1 hypothetical protein MCOR25_006993 [Pyricularia grisea]TLD13279.1 hypothetical protein PgNI_04067 [Pyricularia grisea]